jgi:hypothetical protein
VAAGIPQGNGLKIRNDMATCMTDKTVQVDLYQDDYPWCAGKMCGLSQFDLENVDPSISGLDYEQADTSAVVINLTPSQESCGLASSLAPATAKLGDADTATILAQYGLEVKAGSEEVEVTSDLADFAAHLKMDAASANFGQDDKRWGALLAGDVQVMLQFDSSPSVLAVKVVSQQNFSQRCTKCPTRCGECKCGEALECSAEEL